MSAISSLIIIKEKWNKTSSDYYYYLTCPHKRKMGIQIRNLYFMRHGCLPIELQINSLLPLMIFFPRLVNPDGWIWILATYGQFSVRSTHEVVSHNSTSKPSPFSPKIWNCINGHKLRHRLKLLFFWEDCSEPTANQSEEQHRSTRMDGL